MQLNLVHKFLPSFFRGAMTSWAQLALIGTTHRLTTNAWVGKTLSGRECWNKSAPNYQKGHLWISTPPPLSPGCSGFFPSDDNPFTKVPFNVEIILSIDDETQLRKSPLDVKILLSVWWYSVYKSVLLDVEKLFVLWGETQFTKCQRALLQWICFQFLAPGSSSSASGSSSALPT